MALKIRRGTDAERLTITPESGELIYTTDTKKVYVGDGGTAGGTIVTGTTSVVQDTSPQLGGNLDLNSNNIIGTGNINITGTITATGNINLGDGAGGDVITIGGSIDGSLIPDEDLSYSIGSTTKRFLNVHAVQADIQGTITADAYTGDIVADDSTVIIDSTSQNITGNNFTGALFTGNTAGEHTGSVIGDITGSLFADDSTLIVDAINQKVVAPLDAETATIGNTGLFINGSGAIATTARQEFIYTGATTPSTVLSTFLTREGTQQKFVIQTRPNNTYISHEDNGLSGITMYSDYATFGGMHLRVNPANTTFTKPTDALQVDGDATITGTISSSFVGSLASDNSTMVVDNNGTIVNLAFTGEVGNTPATPGSVDSWLEVTVNGATKYIPLYV